MIKYMLLAGMALAIGQADANVVINATRVIYQEPNKDVIVQLINNGDTPSLIQSWLDDGDIGSTPETANVPFLLSPPVVRIAGRNGQQLRIKKSSTPHVNDRESVFYLNVLDIPPVPENMRGLNTLQLAVKSRIKLFYRPAGLKIRPEKMTDNISIYAQGTQLTIKNDSPYHFTLANIDRTDHKKLLSDATMVAPFSHAIVKSKAAIKKNERLSVIYVDDFGAYKEKTLTSH
ncbi:Chaperone protein fimC precursor [Serratia fonticola]|uniref:Chaperone protein fimC n=1 Tax=Serratia fonticola TaxID=47917 RepID=A0A0F7H875_SERFO|nr:molecular chaperone [Serratia fonticola]AKG68306.1 pilus assembly protein [Serratia fonticola]CAI1531485.1 Chaperone protein fimC precursor [Serratia fonticola]VTR51694.1 Chaperone protein fimC precursor [Serratia fonticola]